MSENKVLQKLEKHVLISMYRSAEESINKGNKSKKLKNILSKIENELARRRIS